MYKKIVPEDVFITMFEGDAVNGQFLCDDLVLGVGNRASGNDFIDFFARLVHKYQCCELNNYADMMGCDTASMCVTFSVLTGMSTTHWRNRYIALCACEMLEQSNISISSIAARLGFARTTVFTQFFIRQRGETPSSWRKARGRKA